MVIKVENDWLAELAAITLEVFDDGACIWPQMLRLGAGPGVILLTIHRVRSFIVRGIFTAIEASAPVSIRGFRHTRLVDVLVSF